MNVFLYPEMFLLLILPFVIWSIFPAIKGLHGDALKVTFLQDLQNISLKAGKLWRLSAQGSFKKSRHWWLLYIIFACLVTAAARPVWQSAPIRLKTEGRDILMVIDISTSMLEPDFKISGTRTDRLTAVKKVATDFINKRLEDRIGLVLFGTNAYLQAPLTFDKKSVIDILWQTDAGMAGNSTAIGNALGVALKSLKSSDNLDKKVIILLTDGENNDGSVSLSQAINLAQKEGVKVYTVGVGSQNSFVQSFFGIQIASPEVDESGLKQIADATQGTYFRADNTESLAKVYNKIDELEPSQNDSGFVVQTIELFYIPLLWSILGAIFLIIISRGAKIWKK